MKIEKVHVTKGVYFIRIPDADLNILCGCPSDVVKHLMKQGLIVTVERNGVTYETGPNAILLSDVMLQSGVVANMAEFPVLQMLYRQGMLLPGHPNNTGAKPLIIGSEKQVKAQMEYIYRGNYGLISEQEIIDAGMTPDAAKQLMRIKLKFAFGAIRATEDLLDSLVVGDGETEIRNGATIRRTATNMFEISFDGETVSVDLNLGKNEEYDPPYFLSMHNIPREYFGVIHTGEGDGWDINRTCMASILMFHGKIYLIDAGPNILYNLKSLGIGLNEIEGIFHTHAHDDHFAGLTDIIGADHRIRYYATPLVRASVTKKLCALLSIEEARFENLFDVHDLVFDEWNNVDGLEVKPVLSPHPVETNILFFRAMWSQGYRTYAHFADIASFKVLEGMVTEDPDAIGISPEYFDEVKQTYLTEADLKKLDVGGGLIHGDAVDFRDDGSRKSYWRTGRR
ncbi:MAG: MBL fold metallo-hydrolase, partial [Alphaproteobacteria bacterium]|nr:MBL fold metallo-hydrolase [Alphaproteobacteria bacterium]